MNEIEKIASYLQDCADPVENENIYADLKDLWLKIKTGEYKNTSFLTRNSFDSGKRTYEFFNYLLGYHQQAEYWQDIFSLIPLHFLENSADLCTGSSPKVQWALQKKKFQGKHAVIEREENIIPQFTAITRLLNISYPIRFLHEDVMQLQGHAFDLITANHVIDDLLLCEGCRERAILLSELYQQEEKLIKFIHELVKTIDKQQFVHRFVTSIANNLQQSGYFILVHYQSVTEQALNIHAWDKLIQQLFDEIRQKMTETAFTMESFNKNADKQCLIVKKL